MTWLELTQPLACAPPPCVPPGGHRALEASWELLSILVKRVVKEAGASAGQAGCIDLGGKRTFTVAEALVLEAMLGPRFAATAAEAVCPELLPKKRLGGKISDVAKEAKSIRFGDSTSISITDFLKSPVFARQPGQCEEGHCGRGGRGGRRGIGRAWGGSAREPRAVGGRLRQGPRA